MPLKEAQAYFNQPDAVTVLEVALDSPDKVNELAPKVIEAGGPTIYISDWRQRNATFFTALEVERNVMFLILTLIVLVAALNIISGMRMLVKDKVRDIAILRTMGATRHAVMRIFCITGATIGISGTLAGLVLGVIVCWNIETLRKAIAWITDTELFSPELYYLTQMPAEMDTGETVSVVIMALTLIDHRNALPVLERVPPRSRRSLAQRVGTRGGYSASCPGASPREAWSTPMRKATRRSRSCAAHPHRCARARRWDCSVPPAPANRPCCTLPDCSNGRMAARSSSMASIA